MSIVLSLNLYVVLIFSYYNVQVTDCCDFDLCLKRKNQKAQDSSEVKRICTLPSPDQSEDEGQIHFVCGQIYR